MAAKQKLNIPAQSNSAEVLISSAFMSKLLDDERMELVKEFCNLYLISAIASIVVEYARLSELETFISVFTSAEDERFVLETFHSYNGGDCDSTGWMRIIGYWTLEEVSLSNMYLNKAVYKFDVVFGNMYDSPFEYTIPAEMLVPSAGLKLDDFVSEDLLDIVDGCREKYLAEIKELMSRI